MAALRFSGEIKLCVIRNQFHPGQTLHPPLCKSTTMTSFAVQGLGRAVRQWRTQCETGLPFPGADPAPVTNLPRP